MNDIQEVFNRVQDTKKKQRELKKQYKDELAANQEYNEIIEKLEVLKARKKQIEAEVLESDNYKPLASYAMHIKTDKEMLSDLALNKLVSGDTVEVKDENDLKYEPLFSVKFKKV